MIRRGKKKGNKVRVLCGDSNIEIAYIAEHQKPRIKSKMPLPLRGTLYQNSNSDHGQELSSGLTTSERKNMEFMLHQRMMAYAQLIE